MDERIIKVITENLDVEPDEIKPEASIMKDLGADSLDMVELAMAFEKEYDIKIETEQISAIKTVQDLVDFIAANKKG